MEKENNLEYYKAKLNSIIKIANLLMRTGTGTGIKRKTIMDFNTTMGELNKRLNTDFHTMTVHSYNLPRLTYEGEGVLAYLISISPTLKPEESKKITILRSRIEKMECENILKKNLSSSLKKLEEGFSLGSMLVSGRIIDHCISQLKAKYGEKVVEKLEGKNKFPVKKEDRDGAEKELMRKLMKEHDPEKKYRNRTSHNIYYFPQPDEAFRELSNAIMLTEKISD